MCCLRTARGRRLTRRRQTPPTNSTDSRAPAGVGDNERVKHAPTAPLAVVGLIGGFGVAVLSGSRALGGLVLGICGLVCIAIWLQRDGRHTALMLTIAGLFAFAFSHVLGLLIGAWPAVLLTAAAVAVLYWRASDSRIARARS